MSRTSVGRPLALTAALASLLAACAGPQASQSAQSAQSAQSTGAAPIEVGIIAINDFHGALEAPKQAVPAPDGKGGTVAVPAGGAAWLASAVDSLKAGHPNTVVVAAGDLTGASQLASNIYLDEPAVGVMNRIGLEFNAVGNHEFDRGSKELLRLQNGGCEKNTRREPCQLEQFAGADFKYLSASTYTADGKTLFPATGLRTFGNGDRKVSVGFVGLALKTVPELVTPGGVNGLTFGDEAEAINRAVPLLKEQGADAIVVLIHQGGRTTGTPNPDGCEGMNGDILPILSRLDPRVDVVVSGHTHWSYVCNYGDVDPTRPILLTSAGVYGELVTDITLDIDPATRRVIGKKAQNVIVQSEGYTSPKGNVAQTDAYPAFQPRADVAQYVQQYLDAAKAFTERPIGRLSGPIPKSTEKGISVGGTLGNLAADSQLAATKADGAVIAFTNPSSLRTDLIPAADGQVTFGQIFAVSPFGNVLVTETLTGAQIKAVIEQGLDDDGMKQALSPSEGFEFRFDMSRPSGDRVVSVLLHRKPIDPAGKYRVTLNSFLAGGGDGFRVFTQGTDQKLGVVDIEALEDWIKAVPVRTVPRENRSVEIRR